MCVMLVVWILSGSEYPTIQLDGLLLLAMRQRFGATGAAKWNKRDLVLGKQG